LVVIVASPDKLSISMFCDFLKKTYGSYNPSFVMKDVSCLYSSDIQESLIKRVIEEAGDDSIAVIRYYIKKKTDLKKVSPLIWDKSDYLIKFDIYSNTPELLKVPSEPYFANLLDNWKENIKKLSM